MGIEATQVPTRSKLWTEEDARQAFDLLTGTVRDEDGNPIEDGNLPDGVERPKPQAAKFNTYTDPDGKDEDGSKRESKARTQGMALDRLIASKFGRRFGVSVWKDEHGNIIGALVPRAPVARKKKGSESGKPAATRKRS